MDESPFRIITTYILAFVAGYGIAAFGSMFLIFFWFLTSLVWKDREVGAIFKAWAWLPGALQSMVLLGTMCWILFAAATAEHVALSLRLVFLSGVLASLVEYWRSSFLGQMHFANATVDRLSVSGL
ncbi:hypothetical protein [Stigmatella hybrida]|uniref:hypothetical protein n=1 Tax=Stigmatella hybrida TaxID=394097 RepID=UPI001CDB3915|nr:hypothetical protein [Stigmatella hybrida]